MAWFGPGTTMATLSPHLHIGCAKSTMGLRSWIAIIPFLAYGTDWLGVRPLGYWGIVHWPEKLMGEEYLGCGIRPWISNILMIPPIPDLLFV